MGNKKVLSKATRELNKTKRFAAPKNIIEDPRGQWAHPGEITRIPSDRITMQGVPYPVMAYPNMGEPQMMYPGQDYVFPGADYVDEYPQMKRGGTPKSLVKMPKPSKKGLASKKFSRSLEATNRLFTENPLFAKPKSKKRKVFDPNAYYQDGGLMTQEEIDGATEGMMKARLAYAQMHGNPAAQRMVVAPDQPYVFDHGNTGTHFMASMDNYAVPLIQDVNGQLMLGDFGPESAEAMRFDNPEDAMYFAEHYKEITPDESYRREEEYQEGGMTAPLDLDPKTMKRYLADLKDQENNIKKGYRGGKWYPHPSPEGGLDTIAYGHKLTSRNSPYYQGISDEQAEALLLKDVLQNQALAKKQVDAKFGEGTFDSLPQDRQMLLVDYQYNLGTLAEFPKFVKAVVEGDTKTMIAEHTRYGGKDPLTRRNQWTLNVIDNLTQPIPEKPSNGITIPLANVPDATNVVLPQIEGGPEGAIELELSPEEIEQYQMGGYIVEDVEGTNEAAMPCPPGYIFDPRVGRCVPESAYRLSRASVKDNVNVDDALRENRRYYEGYEFMKDWQNSPMYDKMLKAGARSPESYEYMKKMRQQQLDSTPPLQILPQPEDEPNTGGYSMNATGQIVILPEGFRTRGTHSHELSHSSDRPVRGKRSRLIPQRDIDYVNKNKAKTIADSRAYHNYKDEYDPMFKEYPEYKQQVDDSFKSFSTDYVGEPTEVRARLNAIRQLSKEAGLYDPFTQGVSPDLYYKKLKNYQFEKGDKSGFDPMRQLQDTFSDEEIIWLLNNMSKTEDNKPELNVAQEGGSPDPKTNFYTVEGSGGVYRKVNGRWEVDWNRSGKFQPLSKGDVKKRAAVLDKKAKPLYDATYDDLYATQRSAYTAPAKPTPAKKPTAQDKAAQEQFDKNFQVTGKSKMEVVEDKIQKTADDYAKYHQQQTGKPLTQEEYDDAYQDIYNRAYVDAGTYKPNMSGPVANPYGTTELRKNLISLDPGKAPKNLTLGDYVDKGWDIVSNPLDYASYALRPKGTVTTPWNMTNYENRLEAAGLEDPITANNNVSKAIDFATYFTPIGAAAQGLKMIPGTAYSIGKAFEEPSWENTGDALFNTGIAALSLAPGFGAAKNLGRGASSIDDLKAIEALRGNTATTPFQSYYLTGNRALNASEAALPQAQALRRFINPETPQLPAGRPQIMSESTKAQLTNPAVDSYFPLRYGDEPYAAAGNEMYHVDPEDFTVWNEATKQWEISPNWRQEGADEFNWIWDDALSKRLKPLNPGKSDNLGPWEFSQFSPGWEAVQEAKGYLAGPQRMPKKSDYLTDNEFFKLMSQEMKYNILDDERKVQEAILGRKISDAEFAEMNPGVVRPDFTQKMLTEEQRKIVNDLLSDNPSVKSNPLLRENLQKLLDQNIGDVKATSRSSGKPFRPGDIPMSLNRTADLLPKGSSSSKNPLDQLAALIKRKRSKSEISALDDLDTIRLQSKTGQANAEELLNAEIEQKLKDLDTPEGRRRVQKYIEDNNLVNEEYDPGNFDELAREYQAELPRILADKYSDESQRIVELVRNKMAASKRVPSLAGLKSWNELEAEHILNNPILRMQSYEAIVPADPRFTGKYIKRPFTHDEYVESIENILYKDVSEDIDRLERSIQVSENEIKQLAIEKNTLNRDLRAEQDLSMRAMIQQRIHNTNRRILDAHNRIAFNKQSMNSLGDYLNRENASFQPIDNTISFGEPYTAIGDLLSTMTHEIGHSTEMVGVPFSNSAIDRALIKNLTFRKKAPSYLYKKFDPDKARETAPSDISNQGIKKYRDPERYFRSNLNYFKVGNKMVVGDSNEPTAFAVEMRPALKELGLIKDNFDIVTPETIEKLYVEYITNPKFQFRDLRIFDIMEPTKKNFKELAKHYNDIKSLLPYAVPVGLGVGATGLAGQEEIQQDMEYQDGGIIMELSDDEIQQYANGGFVVEELEYRPDAGKTLNKKVASKPKTTINTEGLAYRPSASTKPQNPNAKANVQTNPSQQRQQNVQVPKPKVITDSMSTVLDKYAIGDTSPIMSIDVFQDIVTKQNQEKQAKLELLQRQLEASQAGTSNPNPAKRKQPSITQYEFTEEFIKGMPNVRTEQSESYLGGRPLKNEVKKVVLHHTGSTDEKNNNKYVHNHFMNPDSETSAHVVIEEDGTRTIYASPDQVTFHAGKSTWDGRTNVNDFGVGIEFQGDTNVKPLTSAQIRSFVEYFDQLAKKYNVSTQDIITHAMIAPGRKPDITESQYKRILKYLKERGYE